MKENTYQEKYFLKCVIKQQNSLLWFDLFFGHLLSFQIDSPYVAQPPTCDPAAFAFQIQGYSRCHHAQKFYFVYSSLASYSYLYF